MILVNDCSDLGRLEERFGSGHSKRSGHSGCGRDNCGFERHEPLLRPKRCVSSCVGGWLRMNGLRGCLVWGCESALHANCDKVDGDDEDNDCNSLTSTQVGSTSSQCTFCLIQGT